MSSDSNRPRPRSSKKQRARQGSSSRAATERARAGATRSGSASGGGGLSTAWLAVIAVVVFAIGAALAGGAIQFGGGATPSSAVNGRVSLAPGSSAGDSPVARGTNCPTAQPPAAPAGQKRIVTIETANGQIQATLDSDLAPIAVGNFAALAGCGFYDGIVFHRIATLEDGTPFVIQGGDPDGTGGGGPGYEIQDEPVTTTYVRGTVAMARTSAPNSVGSQFFIVLDDKDQAVLASANTYQIIGSVTAGMDTVDAIYAAANGQESPADPVVMTKVTIGPPVAPTPVPSSATPSIPVANPSPAPS
ncbi:MAG: peptidylprolyl isomerase [Candidatus Limnocylindrales bacterium]